MPQYISNAKLPRFPSQMLFCLARCNHVASHRLSTQNSSPPHVRRVSNNHGILNNQQPPLQSDVDPPNDYQHDGSGSKFGPVLRKGNDNVGSNGRVRNSYLKIIMNDNVYDQLHHTVCQIRHLWEEENNINDHTKQSMSTKKSRRQLLIKPRSLNSLHMTYFFAGTVLEEMACEELQLWKTMVKKCVVAHSNVSPVDYYLRFKSIIVFPPSRSNLIVAVFEASSALEELYEKLCELAVMEKQSTTDTKIGNDNSMRNEVFVEEMNDWRAYEFPLLRELTLNQQPQRKQHRFRPWVAHVTLANLVGGSKGEVNRLSKWLADKTHQLQCAGMKSNGENSQLLSVTSAKPYGADEKNIAVLGLELGGPVPGHADIVWDFPFGEI
ncbi:hypothetical protein ACHAW5_005087 [Stephanodiscus triporus]|uniref:Protein kinase A anchor protein nuclear localisation signal domain-containing protein n=1 Tax=Stephanodiscus triporus TaxID=2934178 RepID=A0ABD3MGE1_9STRA